MVGAAVMMRAGRRGSDAEIPVLPLVDILFSAFAAILATATVVVAMMRTRDPDAALPALPIFTIVAKSAIPSCTDKLRPGFRVRNGDDVVSYTVDNFAWRATATFQNKPGINAWYLADRVPDPDLTRLCGGSAACVRAELVVLGAKPGSFTFEPVVAQDLCPDAQIAFQLGVVSDDQQPPLTFAPPNPARSITIEVPRS
jgi:hypothetical protein